MSGKWGLDVNWLIKSCSGIRAGVAPGKWVLKNWGRRRDGLLARVSKCEEGAKSVQVKEWSSDGIAMNIMEPAGQMCRWWGEMAKAELELEMG